MSNTFIEKLKSQSIKDSNWLEKAKWRQENEAWLDISFAIALKILRVLREKNMKQKDLADLLDLSPQYINKIVKGSENLTIETISRIEQALKIKLIEVPNFNLVENYVSDDFWPSVAAFQQSVILPVETVSLMEPKDVCCDYLILAA